MCVEGEPVLIPNCTEPTACVKPSGNADMCAVVKDKACFCGGVIIYSKENACD